MKIDHSLPILRRREFPRSQPTRPFSLPAHFAVPAQGRAYPIPRLRFGLIAPDEKRQILDQLHHPDFMAREAALNRLYRETEIKDADILRTLARFAFYEDEFQAGKDVEKVRTFSKMLSLKILEKNPSPWGMEGALIGIREVGSRPQRRYNAYLLTHHYPQLPSWLQKQFRARLYSWVINRGGSADDEAVRVLKEFAPLSDVPFIWHTLKRQKSSGNTGLPDTRELIADSAKNMTRILLGVLMREQPEALPKLLDTWHDPANGLGKPARNGMAKAFSTLYDVTNETRLMQDIRHAEIFPFLKRYESEFVYDYNNNDCVSESYLPRYMDFKLGLLQYLPEAVRQKELVGQAKKGSGDGTPQRTGDAVRYAAERQGGCQ